jgi:predicted RNA-binding Zn ribbon-like protein
MQETDWTEPGDRTAPEPELHLLQAFVNTNDLEGGDDELGTPQLLRDWLVERGLMTRSEPVDEEQRLRALQVREGIRALGRANNGEPLDAEQVRQLNTAAAGIPVVVSVEPGAWTLQPAAGGVDGFLGRIMAALARSMADGSWDRMKACRSDTCRWLFFDQSRNRSGTWCSMAVCGSRMKARAYRSRQRAASA